MDTSKDIADFQHEWLVKQAKDYWKKQCPSIFRVCDQNKVPNPESYKRVTAWKYSPRGLLCFGPTARGKTRAAWQLVKRLSEEGVPCIHYDGVTFAHDCATAFGPDGIRPWWMESSCLREDKMDGPSWIKELFGIQLLFLDDLGKGRMTERTEAELFGLLDRRFSDGRPVLLTCNFSAEALAAKVSEDRGAPLVRRLKEFCEPIAF